MAATNDQATGLATIVEMHSGGIGGWVDCPSHRVLLVRYHNEAQSSLRET